jgi:hypothetical protein
MAFTPNMTTSTADVDDPLLERRPASFRGR